MSQHPSEINQHLDLARAGIERLIEDAYKRHDVNGADAWRAALIAVVAAEEQMRQAREKQKWERPLREPPQAIIKAALQSAQKSPCAKSKRGAVIFRRGATSDAAIVGRGYNSPPWTELNPVDDPKACDGSNACKASCAKRCVHAESRALRCADLGPADLNVYDLVHVKLGPAPMDGPVVTNLPMVTVVPGGGPSCWQCSREILDSGLAGVWLFEQCRVATPAWTNEWGEWRYYTTKEFHEATLKACGIHPYPMSADGDKKERTAIDEVRALLEQDDAIARAILEEINDPTSPSIMAYHKVNEMFGKDGGSSEQRRALFWRVLREGRANRTLRPQLGGDQPTERAWLPSNPPTVESPGQCPWVLPDGDPDEGYWHCKLGDGHSERHVTEFGRGLEEMWLLRCKGDAHTFVGDACRDCGMPVSAVPPVTKLNAQANDGSCRACGGSGVIETGNNDLPCDCPAGDRAIFNSDRGRETGASLKARRR